MKTLKFTQKLYGTVRVPQSIKISEISGIDGEHCLNLKKKDSAYTDLNVNIPVKISSFDGKHGTDEFFPGQILKINIRKAVIKTTQNIEKFSNLKISILEESIFTNEISIHGKVIKQLQNNIDEKYFENIVYFTATPKELGEIIRKYGK